jgi:hypothetical protein
MSGGPTLLTSGAQPPLTASGASRGPDGEKAEAFSMPHMILDLGFKCPLQLTLWYKERW